MANKKINQLVLKTTIQPTDLFPLGDATTGQLFKKTVAELQAAIGGAVISVNGLVGTVVLDTDDIAELATPTNRYFTEARARAAISLTTTGNSGASTYSNSTGVLNVPTYTLAGLGGITASFLSGGTGITYNSSTGVIAYSGTVYTDASIRALFSAGTGITYNSSTGAISYSGTVYTDSSIRGLFSLTTTGTSGAATYNNTTGVINVPNYTLAGLGGISLTALSGTAPITYNSSTGAIGITQASTSTNGFLSSTDWNTFNGKQSALTLGNVSEVVSNVLMFPDGGTNKTIGNLTIQVVQAGSTTNGFLSTTDWNTFNNKQGTITLTTTGTSGAATFSGGTLNIPQYAAAFSGTTNYVAKFTSSSTIGNSNIQDSGSLVTISSPTTITGTLNLTSSNIINSDAASTNVYHTFNRNSATGYEQMLKWSTAGTAKWYVGLQGGTSDAFGIYSEVAGRNAMTINTAGNVGIGTSSPLNRLFVTNTGGAINVLTDVIARFNATTNTSTQGSAIALTAFSTKETGVILGAEHTSGNNGDFVVKIYNGGADYPERLRVTSAGNVGIGTSSPTGLLQLNGSIANSADSSTFTIKQSGTSSTNGIYIERNGERNGYFMYIGGGVDSLTFRRNYFGTQSNVMSLTRDGNILLGTDTDNGERLYVSGSIRATGSITANSDVRLKKNIERIENALEKVGQISGYTYNTIYDQDRHAGVIAQEINKVLPEIVNKGNDGLMGVEYGNISALLIEAIKDLKKDNESLRAIVEGLTK
jgi:hypothetical protein